MSQLVTNEQPVNTASNDIEKLGYDTPATYKSLQDQVNNINVYVSEDGKLHYVDKDGADSELPFSSVDELKSFLIDNKLVYLSKNIGDKFQLDGRFHQRASDKPLVMFFSFTGTYYSYIGISDSEDAFLATTDSEYYGTLGDDYATPLNIDGKTIYGKGMRGALGSTNCTFTLNGEILKPTVTQSIRVGNNNLLLALVYLLFFKN